MSNTFVLEFGSHLRDPAKARDIDVLYRGVSKEEAEEIVRARYPSETHLPVDATPASEYMHCVEIPAPCDSTDTEHRFLWIGETGVEPMIAVKRHCDTVASILREGAGWEKAYERLQKKEYVELPLEERNDGNGKGGNLSHNYLTGRLSLAKAARDHFGEKNLDTLCGKLWWGPVLDRLVREKPDEGAVAEIRRRSGPWSGEASRLFASNKERVFATQYGPRPGAFSVKRTIAWLYPGTKNDGDELSRWSGWWKWLR